MKGKVIAVCRSLQRGKPKEQVRCGFFRDHWGLIGDAHAGTVGMVFSIQTEFSDKRAQDVVMRLALAGFALVVLFNPNMRLAVMAILPIGLFAASRLLRHRKIRA